MEFRIEQNKRIRPNTVTKNTHIYNAKYIKDAKMIAFFGLGK